MNKRIRTRSIVTLALTALSIVLFAGFPPSLAGLQKNIRLGLETLDCLICRRSQCFLNPDLEYKLSPPFEIEAKPDILLQPLQTGREAGKKHNRECGYDKDDDGSSTDSFVHDYLVCSWSGF